MNKKDEDQFFKMPMYFFDYGLQVFTHTEYDILQYILRNTIGWNKFECELSIKKIALMKKYSEKNIINSINNLIEKTNVFSKVVYYEKGCCIKKTKYIITENSVKILNEYVRKNLPTDFDSKLENLKNRSVEAMKRLEKSKQDLMEKQSLLLQTINTENAENTIETMIENDNNVSESSNENKEYLLDAYKEIINDYDYDSGRYSIYDDRELHNNIFSEYKQIVYDACLNYIPKEANTEKIDIQLSDLLRFTDNNDVINFYNTLIEKKKMTDKQKNYFFKTLKINFGITNENNFDRINVVYK